MLDMLEDLREVDRMARRCVRRTLRFRSGWDVHDMTQEARAAILERLAWASAANVEISAADLLAAASRELDALDREQNRALGDRATVYWMDIAGDDGIPQVTGNVKVHTDEAPFVEPFIERLALIQAFRQLRPSSQEILLVHALHDCRAEATAEHLLVTPTRVFQRLRQARQEFYEHWFDWEPVPAGIPSARRRDVDRSTHCAQGHEFTPENTSYRLDSGRRKRYRYCLTCNRENVARQKARRKMGDTS